MQDQTRQGAENTAYLEATIRTANNLKTIATRAEVRDLSSLELPEIQWISDEIARVVPAGNVPGLILSGLTRIDGRYVQTADSQKYIQLLFQGVQQTLNRTIYSTFFAGPAAVLYGYQLLLKLAGKEPETAFPEGTWQFYLEFALREDSAHHTNETVGFQNTLYEEQVGLDDADQLASWILAVSHVVQQHERILANEWRERVTLRLLINTITEHQQRKAQQYEHIHKAWAQVRPYQRPYDDGWQDFAAFREHAFDQFLHQHLKGIRRKTRNQINTKYAAISSNALPAYIDQMSWFAYLQPDSYREKRIRYNSANANVGIILNGCYFLISLSDGLDITMARQIARAIISSENTGQTLLDDMLLRIPRAEQTLIRNELDTETQHALERLRFTPIIINWDQQDGQMPLSRIRQAKHGVGDHPLTIIRTTNSMAFDQSHIFFDGIWGAAIAEIMTNEAIYWAKHITRLGAIRSSNGIQPLTLNKPKKSSKIAESYERKEATAENNGVDLEQINTLRQLLRQRSESTYITVNDILILYRGLHTVHYQPSAELMNMLATLRNSRRNAVKEAYKAAIAAIEESQNKNPALLIPIDASNGSPHERVFPTTFRNPIRDILRYHQQVNEALQLYRDSSPRTARREYKAFQNIRTAYLRVIGGFGELLAAYRAVALTGDSTSTATLRFLAHLPPNIQAMLNDIPGRFNLLNEIIRGEEVFSNIGRVSAGSSLTRFITAIDDNRQKTFAWGIITDDKGIMHISLRDFRPHVSKMHDAGYPEIADQITQDFLDHYTYGLNRYIAELKEITITSSQLLHSIS